MPTAFFLSLLDDSLLEQVGPAPVQTTPGKHIIEAVNPGYVAQKREIELNQGEEISLDIVLEKEAPEPLQ